MVPRSQNTKNRSTVKKKRLPKFYIIKDKRKDYAHVLFLIEQNHVLITELSLAIYYS